MGCPKRYHKVYPTNPLLPAAKAIYHPVVKERVLEPTTNASAVTVLIKQSHIQFFSEMSKDKTPVIQCKL